MAEAYKCDGCGQLYFTQAQSIKAELKSGKHILVDLSEAINGRGIFSTRRKCDLCVNCVIKALESAIGTAKCHRTFTKE